MSQASTAPDLLCRCLCPALPRLGTLAHFVMTECTMWAVPLPAPFLPCCAGALILFSSWALLQLRLSLAEADCRLCWCACLALVGCQA